MENFNLISSNQHSRFMLALGNHPFQANNEMRVGKSFADIYQRNRLLLLLNTIINEISETYHQLNDDIGSIMYVHFSLRVLII